MKNETHIAILYGLIMALVIVIIVIGPPMAQSQKTAQQESRDACNAHNGVPILDKNTSALIDCKFK